MITNKDKIKDLENISLSDKQLMSLIDNEANLVLYPDLHKFKNIDDLLGRHGACIILYESKPNYGHWTAIFKTNNPKELEFFNSYGDSGRHDGYPDATLKFIPKDFRILSKQDHTYLAKLMVDSPYSLSYNQYKFQSDAEGIKTCGRHVANRLRMRHLSLDEYHNVIMKYCRELRMNPDQIVSLLTSEIN